MQQPFSDVSNVPRHNALHRKRRQVFIPPSINYQANGAAIGDSMVKSGDYLKKRWEADQRRERLREIARKLNNPREYANKYERAQWNQGAGINSRQPKVSPEDERWLLRRKKQKEREANVPRTPLDIAINKGPGKNPKSLAETITETIALGPGPGIAIGNGFKLVPKVPKGGTLRTTSTTRSGKPYQELLPSTTHSGKNYGKKQPPAPKVPEEPPTEETPFIDDEQPGPSSAPQPKETSTPKGKNTFKKKGKKAGNNLEMDSTEQETETTRLENGPTEETTFTGPPDAAPKSETSLESEETTRDDESTEAEFWRELDSDEPWLQGRRGVEQDVPSRFRKAEFGIAAGGATFGLGIGLSKPPSRSGTSKSTPESKVKTPETPYNPSKVGGSAAAWLDGPKRKIKKAQIQYDGVDRYGRIYRRWKHDRL